eukprot:2957928-Alexandrium_andersonii.AAC.1
MNSIVQRLGQKSRDCLAQCCAGDPVFLTMQLRLRVPVQLAARRPRRRRPLLAASRTATWSAPPAT